MKGMNMFKARAVQTVTPMSENQVALMSGYTPLKILSKKGIFLDHYPLESHGARTKSNPELKNCIQNIVTMIKLSCFVLVVKRMYLASLIIITTTKKLMSTTKYS